MSTVTQYTRSHLRAQSLPCSKPAGDPILLVYRYVYTVNNLSVFTKTKNIPPVFCLGFSSPSDGLKRNFLDKNTVNE